MTVWVALPAYNEGPRLPSLLDRWTQVLSRHEHRYVVVDDGSTDETPRILRAFAADQPATVITHAQNEGLGASVRDLLQSVAAYADDDDVMVMMDADNTHPPELLHSMLRRMRDSGSDVVIASRYRTGSRVMGLGLLRRMMSRGVWILFRLVFPVPGVRDFTCGYRLYRVAMVKRAFEVYGDRFCDRQGFECMIDIVLRLARLGARFAEVGMQLDYAAKAGHSSMKVPRTVWATLKLLVVRRFERPPARRPGGDAGRP